MENYVCVDVNQWKADQFHADYLELKAINRNEAKRQYSVWANGDKHKTEKGTVAKWIVYLNRMTENKQRYAIGLDTGVNTGFAIWDTQDKKLECFSIMIHQAFELTLKYKDNCFVYVEDARLRKFITGGREKLQGAGSIKRDAKIWEDFLTDKNIPFKLIAPKNNRTKLDSALFKKITGFKGSTNQHARDAAMLVFGKEKSA